jgi:hypothetical protein
LTLLVLDDLIDLRKERAMGDVVTLHRTKAGSRPKKKPKPAKGTPLPFMDIDEQVFDFSKLEKKMESDAEKPSRPLEGD